MMKKAIILLIVLEVLIAIMVGVLVYVLVTPALAEDSIDIPTMINMSEEQFFEMLREVNQKYDCHIKVSNNDELLIALVLYGTSTPDEYTIDTIVYNKEQKQALWINGNVDITAGVLKTIESIGLENPEQYICEEKTLGFDEFKIFELGEEISLY